MLNGYLPIFSQFGEDIFASDVVQACIDVIATEISKLRPKHIRTDNNDVQTIVNSSINRLFKFSPNELMTTRDFLEKTIWLLFLNLNVFIYPTYDIVKDSSGRKRKEYTGFYPLNPYQVEFMQDNSGKLFVKFFFRNGSNYTLAYSDVIHLRKKFSVNDVMGGGINGQPDNDALLKVLQINDNLLQGLEKTIKSSMTVRGILKMNTMMKEEGLDEERKKFEEKMKNNESGILPMDMKGEYHDIKIDPKLVDKDTLDFLDSKILKNYGVSLPIISGEFTDDQYQAFYERTLESIVIGLGQSFSKCLFTNRELDFGNEIVFYQKDMMYLSMKNKLEIIKIGGEQGIFTDNEKLKILGYSPIEGGERRTQSLNYINRDIIDEYQVKRGKME
ncbi:phage portal protein [Gracilibacillus saliphilus]|uniref:phage portal protein n=1 Tax=Gracilibacillus saliphilus TaxID=543890 RepID=UPI0013D3A82E|nr:phage portal protein [Gracilibacillus saliphilus]